MKHGLWPSSPQSLVPMLCLSLPRRPLRPAVSQPDPGGQRPGHSWAAMRPLATGWRPHPTPSSEAGLHLPGFPELHPSPPQLTYPQPLATQECGCWISLEPGLSPAPTHSAAPYPVVTTNPAAALPLRSDTPLPTQGILKGQGQDLAQEKDRPWPRHEQRLAGGHRVSYGDSLFPPSEVLFPPLQLASHVQGEFQGQGLRPRDAKQREAWKFGRIALQSTAA